VVEDVEFLKRFPSLSEHGKISGVGVGYFYWSFEEDGLIYTQYCIQG
jgi:hypothetical protein